MNAPFFTLDGAGQFISTWGPRALVGGIAAYQILGYAYAWGWMAEIDKIAIKILLHTVGHAGLGAAMPVFQWYAAKGVQLAAGLTAILIYDQIEKVVSYTIKYFKSKLPEKTEEKTTT